MTVTVSRHIHAPAERVYDLVADLPAMGRWSPENTGGRWLGGATAAAPGAKFKGNNRRGWLRWSTTVTITDATRPTRLAFDVTSGPMKIAQWNYEIAPADGGCTVSESFTEQRGRLAAMIADFGSRVSDRDDHNRRNMEITLERLAAAAEAAG